VAVVLQSRFTIRGKAITEYPGYASRHCGCTVADI